MSFHAISRKEESTFKGYLIILTFLTIKKISQQDHSSNLNKKIPKDNN